METSEHGPGVPPQERYVQIDRTPLTVVALLAIVAAIQFVHHYPDLPDTIATHFGLSGRPDGWSDKANFVLMYSIIEGLILAGAFIMARFGARIPTGAINIPNRNYWMESERRPDSLQFVWNHILWIEAAALAFLIAVAEVVFRANIGPAPPTLPTGDLLVVLATFIAVTGWISLRILMRFRRPRSE